MRVIILYGLPGVGKLTIAKEFGRAHGYRVFHNHLVFDAVEALFSFGSPAFVELRERLWVELMCRAVHERVGNIIFTIARDRSVDASFLIRLHHALSELGTQVHCVEVTCNEEELERRVASVDRSHFGKVHSAERFRELRAEDAFPLFSMPPGTITVDTTGLCVPQAVASIVAKINHAQCSA